MVRILVSPDQLMEVAGRFLTQRQELERMCNRLDKQIYLIREGWSGATREQFFQEYLVARQSMGVTMEQISSIAQQLNFIARSFAEADGEGGAAIVMPSLPLEVGAKLKSGVDYTISGFKGIGATIEGLFDDAVDTGKSLWENPFGTIYNMAYAFTVGRVVDASIGLRFAWDYAWGTGTAQADAERFVEQMKQDVEEKGTGYYAGYVTSQAAAYLTVGKLLKKSRHDDPGGPGGKSKTEGTGNGEKDNYFIGTLKGEKIHLKGVKVEEIIYTKRLPEETAKFRKEFNGSIRKNFLKEFANDPVRVEYLKKAGLGEEDIARMKDGFNPKGWQVHHNLPLDDGGTNEFTNLILIKNDPYHKAITNEQNSLTRGLAPKQSETINWPIFEDDVYPPKPFKRKEE